jgi:hypothetical protein
MERIWAFLEKQVSAGPWGGIIHIPAPAACELVEVVIVTVPRRINQAR